MCGRTSLFAGPAVLEERFDVTVPDEYAPRYNVAPGTPIAAIRDDSPEIVEPIDVHESDPQRGLDEF